VKQQLDWFSAKPDAAATYFSDQSNLSEYYGQEAKSREFAMRALSSAGATLEKRDVASVHAQLSQAEFLMGETELARKDAQSALADSDDQIVDALAGMTMGLLGDSSRAQSAHDDLAKRYPEDTRMQAILLPSLLATIEFGRSNFEKAISLLQPVSKYEMGSAATLGPAYLRGMTYLRLNKGPEAATEFQKLIDHRGVTGTSCLGPLSHLGLARARVLTNDVTGARTEYQTFFAIWKDAEPDLPIFKQAQAEYAKLK
jgi:tetratricopeptide (TPR) repeat protein